MRTFTSEWNIINFVTLSKLDSRRPVCFTKQAIWSLPNCLTSQGVPSSQNLCSGNPHILQEGLLEPTSRGRSSCRRFWQLASRQATVRFITTLPGFKIHKRLINPSQVCGRFGEMSSIEDRARRRYSKKASQPRVLRTSLDDRRWRRLLLQLIYIYSLPPTHIGVIWVNHS